MRFACVGWIESYVRSVEDRSILFGLDAGARGLSLVMAAQMSDLIFQLYQCGSAPFGLVMLQMIVHLVLFLHLEMTAKNKIGFCLNP